VTDKQPIISARDLYKTYRLGRVDVPVLKGVSLEVDRGEFVAILGASGSGKSTLLHLLGGLDRPDKKKGEVLFEGRSLASRSSGELDDFRSRSVGFIFQMYHLFPELTVVENVLIGTMVRHGLGYLARRAEQLKRTTALLERVGLGHRLKHRPVELSGGERQRVAIARALVNSPKVLLADEPTGNLDRTTGNSILEMLSEFHSRDGQTLVVVTHDPETARRANRVVKIEDGRLVKAAAADPGYRPAIGIAGR
jgi:ABC-type lipoprotein export system ATPase subunit